MRVCLICNQIAAWGKIGGFGTATRAIGGGLAKRGVEVVAVVPRRAKNGQRPVEHLDGMTVYGISPWETLTSGEIFRRIATDVYHSQQPTIASYLTQQAGAEYVKPVFNEENSIKTHLYHYQRLLDSKKCTLRDRLKPIERRIFQLTRTHRVR